MLRTDYSEFAPVTTGANDTLKNGLPNESDAEAFQYRKHIDSFVPFGALDLNAGGGGIVVSGEYQFQIIAPGGSLIFEQTVKLRFSVIVQAFGGNVGFFFWSPLDGGNGIIETSIVQGTAVPKDENGHFEGWRFVDTPTPAATSEFGDVRFDFADTSNFTHDGGYISAVFYSPAYVMPVPAGSKLNIVYDRWQMGTLREATYQFSFKGAPSFSALLDWTNNLRMAEPDRGALVLKHRTVRSGQRLGVARIRQVVSGLKNSRVAKTDDDVLWVLANVATQGRLFMSEDGGTTLPRATFRTETGEKKEIHVFGDGYKMLDLKPLPQGGLIALAEKDNKLYIATSADNFMHSQEVGSKKASGLYQLGVGGTGTGDTTVLVATVGHEFSVEGYGSVVERPAPQTG